MDIGTLLSLALLGLAAYHFVKRRGGPLLQYAISLFLYRPAPHADDKDVHEVNELPDRSEAFTATERDVQGTNVPSEPPAVAPPTLDELRKLARAIEHNARGGNKQQALEAAFGVRKGGSAGWRRASQLFDMAMEKE
jgi:hypothetical protein